MSLMVHCLNSVARSQSGSFNVRSSWYNSSASARKSAACGSMGLASVVVALVRWFTPKIPEMPARVILSEPSSGGHMARGTGKGDDERYRTARYLVVDDTWRVRLA